MAKKDDIGYVYIFTYDQRTVPWSYWDDHSCVGMCAAEGLG